MNEQLYAYEFVFVKADGRYTERVVATSDFQAVQECYFNRRYESGQLFSSKVLGKVVPLDDDRYTMWNA